MLSHSMIHRTAVAAGAFGTAGLVAFALGAGLSAGPSSAFADESITATTSTAPASAALLKGFRALAAPDPVAVGAIRKPVGLSLFTSHDPGLNIAAASVVVDTAETSLVLVPHAGDQLCMIRLRASKAAASNCVASAKALTEGVVAAVPGHLYGVLPDDVASVDFELRGGGHTTVATRKGYFEAPHEAIGGSFTSRGVAYGLGELVPESAIPENVHILD